MGGGGQANSGQATGAYNSQQQAATQDAALSKQNAATQKQMVGLLFGNGTPGSTGAVSGMLDPTALNSGSPTGAYNTAWKQAQDQIAQSYKGQRGSLAQSWANSGMGANNTPSGFQADQQRKLGSSEADTRGQTYTGIVGQQHSDALNNFWNGANIAAGQAASSGSTATQASGNQGSSAASLYGTAGQYHPSATASVLGSALGAGGQVGAGMATHCPCVGSAVLMMNGVVKLVEDLVPGDELLGFDGEMCVVESAICYEVPTVRVRTADGCSIDAGASHALITPDRSFVIAYEAIGRTVCTRFGRAKVVNVSLLGKRMVVDIITNGSHSYRADGLWAWGTGDQVSDAYLAERQLQLLEIGA